MSLSRLVSTILVGCVLLIGYQNCSSHGFAVLSKNSQASSPQNTEGHSTPTPAPTPVPTPPPPQGPVPAWMENAAVMQWVEIPDTSIASVEPSPRPPGINGPRSKIETWCGAALKKLGSVYIVGLGGGHGDYAGNEVDALALNTDHPRWIEMIGPSPTDQIVTNSQFYLDLRPSATHTYYASQFIDSLDRFVVVARSGMIMGGLPLPPAGFPYANTDQYSGSFHFSTASWDAPEYFAKIPATGSSIAALVVKHPVTEDIYYSRSGIAGWYQWTRATNTWTKLSNRTRGSWYSGAAIDPNRNRMLVVGSYGAVSAPEVLNFDGSNVTATFTGLGPSALTLGNYPGVIFDEINDRYLVIYNDTSTIELLAVDAATFEVSKPIVFGAKPSNRLNGIQNSVQFVPELRGLVIANSYKGNVFFMRTSP